MAKVVYDGVYKRYPDGTEAIKDLSLDIVGPSGCGKSTALRMCAGLEEISEGQMIIGDKVVNNLTPKERDIAMVFQSYALYPHMTVAENMGFALKLAKVSSDEIDKRVKEAADTLDLTEYLHRKPKALSGGQRQRVAMGRAIVREPQAFLMDEPLSNLDAKLRVAMRTQIAELQNKLGVTTLYVTHDQVEAMTMGDRVAVLKRGVLMQADSPQHLYDNPDNLFVGGFIGSPAMNFAEADFYKEEGQYKVSIGTGDNPTVLDVQDGAIDRYPRVKDKEGQKIALGMRPEHFFPADGETPESLTWPGRRVTLVEQLGAEMLVHFGTSAPPIVTEDMREAIDDEDAFAELQRSAREGGQVFTGRFEPGNPPKIDDAIDIGFRTEYLHFFDMESGEALR
jgi:multiple sugar transport system ATP-binding protein